MNQGDRISITRLDNPNVLQVAAGEIQIFADFVSDDKSAVQTHGFELVSKVLSLGCVNVNVLHNDETTVDS